MGGPVEDHAVVDVRGWVPVADVPGLAGCGRHLHIQKSINLLQLKQLFRSSCISSYNLTIMPVFSTL